MGKIILTTRICRSGRRHNPLETKGLRHRRAPRSSLSLVTTTPYVNLKENRAQKNNKPPKLAQVGIMRA